MPRENETPQLLRRWLVQLIQGAFDRLRKRIEISSTGCWLWQGAVSKDHYGTIKVGPKAISTHRVSYMAVHGEIPRGKVIRHTCDERTCCNPAHLIVGDHEDNNQDIVDRKRNHQRRVLDADEVRVMLEMREAGATKRQIAERFRCNWYTVSNTLDRLGEKRNKLGRPKGSRNLRVKITEEIKEQMREMYETGKFTQQQIAEKFDTVQTYVSLIVRREK